MRKFLLVVGSFILFFGQLLAQNRVITGTVKDANGSPVPSASIIVKGLTKGTSSTSDGSFKITVPASAKSLIISGISFGSTTINIEGKSDLGSITLQASNKNLDEVVVVAYGASKKTNVTGSIVAVKAADIENKPFTSVDKTLQGQVAGLQSTSASGAPGANTDIRIRGIGSLNASASPLWVIDGVIATTGDLTSNTTTANALSTLNPDDIESISVLKDAASTSIYGSRAANGVIIVTTKKGKAGRTSFNLSAEAGQNSQAFLPSNKPVTTLQYQTLMRESLINAGYATDNASADALITDPTNGLGIDPNYTQTNTNWLDVVTQKGPQVQYNASMNGGDAKTQFYASAGYFKQTGTTIKTDFSRFNGNLNVTHKANERLTFTAGINGSSTNQNTPQGSSAFLNPVMESFFLLPWYSPYNADGSFKYNDSLNEFPAGGGLENPVIIQNWNKNNAKQVAIRGNVSGEYKILNNLKFTSRYSAEYFDIQENMYWNPFYGDGYSYGGYVFESYRKIFDWTWSNFADWRHDLNRDKDFYLNLQVGYEAQEQKNYLLQAQGQAFPQTLALEYLASAATPLAPYSAPYGNSTNSIFSVANLNYKDKYVLSGSFRRDGSSVFGANHRWGNFYSVGGTWNISEEDFLKNAGSVSLLKLRASYGENGNAIGFGNYTALPTFGYGYNYTGQPGSALNNVGNPDLTWEKNAILNIGLDWGLWKNRFTGTVEYYDRKTSNLLLNVPLSPTSGAPGGGQIRNIGAMTNKGIEITLGGRPIQTKDFSWDVSFNFSHNTNRVTALYLGVPVLSRGATGSFNYTVGHDVHELYLKQWAGVNPDDGTPLWYTDGTHSKITSDYTAAAFDLSGKSASPKYFGSFTNTFKYKGFSLQAQFYYNFGNYVFDYWAHYFESDGAYLGGYGQLTDQLLAWQKPGDKTNTPQIVYGGNSNATSSYGYSTRYIYKGDYIRLRNVELGYTLPKSALKSIHIASISLYVRGTNLLTFDTDKHIPIDPEAGINSAGNFDVFIPKTITGGIKIGL